MQQPIGTVQQVTNTVFQDQLPIISQVPLQIDPLISQNLPSQPVLQQQQQVIQQPAADVSYPYQPQSQYVSSQRTQATAHLCIGICMPSCSQQCIQRATLQSTPSFTASPTFATAYPVTQTPTPVLNRQPMAPTCVPPCMPGCSQSCIQQNLPSYQPTSVGTTPAIPTFSDPSSSQLYPSAVETQRMKCIAICMPLCLPSCTQPEVQYQHTPAPQIPYQPPPQYQPVVLQQQPQVACQNGMQNRNCRCTVNLGNCSRMRRVFRCCKRQ
ncbi:unnamed protein product [Enterobius vermicularis]|uniref:EB domain-containing protein n=1 Tax=Enterobius vermicularis TaxID=51028 RepID=A0A0N4VH17_ENTVE|nr:unnamed protein product [Enterobius vermicularis]